MDLPGSHQDGSKGGNKGGNKGDNKGKGKKDHTQVWILVGTGVLIVLGYLALKRGGGGGGSTPTQTGAEGGGNTGDQQTDQSWRDSLNGKIADLSAQIAGLKKTPPTSGSTPSNPSTPGTKPPAMPPGTKPPGKTTPPGKALRIITTPKIGAGKRAPSVNPNAGASGSSRSYTVKQGDTLASIAKRFGTTWQKIYEANQAGIQSAAKSHGQWNPKDPGHWIYGGQKLSIPGAPKSTGGTTTQDNAGSKVEAKNTIGKTGVVARNPHPTPKG